MTQPPLAPAPAASPATPEDRVSGVSEAAARWSRPDDALRQTQLDEMKRRATGLVLLAAIVFVAARIVETSVPWVGYIRATAEASLVGGLADWFAVTALFRRPLGLPIPHTAIVATRKDRLGRTLGNFVQTHFLARDVLATRLRSLRIAQRVAGWLSVVENSRRIAQAVASGLAKTLESLSDEDLRALVQAGVSDRIRAFRVAPALGRTLSLVVAGSRHQEILSEAVRLAAQAISDNREVIREQVRAESPWWVPGVVDDKIYHRIVAAVERLLHEIGNNPSHPLRAAFDTALRNFIDRLQHSADVIARAEAMKDEWLRDPAFARLSDQLWETTRRAILGYATRDAGTTPGALERGIAAFGAAVLANETLLEEVDDAVVDVVASVLEQYRAEVADLIAQTVSAWDPAQTAQRIELAIGRDLQFIRINGTLVGGLVGLVLYTIARLWR